MKNLKIGEKNDICLFSDNDFCKRLEALLQSCIELNPKIYGKSLRKDRRINSRGRKKPDWSKISNIIVLFFTDKHAYIKLHDYLHQC
jgi:hypothetical protein